VSQDEATVPKAREDDSGEKALNNFREAIKTLLIEDDNPSKDEVIEAATPRRMELESLP
jgi:hypothetical protein